MGNLLSWYVDKNKLKKRACYLHMSLSPDGMAFGTEIDVMLGEDLHGLLEELYFIFSHSL